MNPTRIAVLASVLATIAACTAVSDHQGHGTNQTDGRLLVKFPDDMRIHTMSNMRDHLSALQEIDLALSRNDFDGAATIAEQRLGMSSLDKHGASHLAPFMPQAMQETGTRMHRAASRFAIESQTASVSHDARPALAALSGVMEQCVACHATFRVQ